MLAPKLIDPPHGPKSVSTGVSAPGSPRDSPLLMKAVLPLMLWKPGPPTPSVWPLKACEPTKIRISFSGMLKLLIWSVVPNGSSGL